MTSGIESIQNYNQYRVQGINLFENSREKCCPPKGFDTGLFASQSTGKHNLNYPKVQGSETQARSLDLLA